MRKQPDRDFELEQLLAESGLDQTARQLSRAAALDVTADPAFRTDLRRRLMREARSLTAGRPSIWKRLFAPQALAWAGATVGVGLIAFVTVNLATRSGTGLTEIVLTAPNITANQPVALVQPLELSFNQPMDQGSVEKAITITPATAVKYEWTSDRTVRITPVAGDLAPNTQYQVKVSPAAESLQNHQQLGRQQTITFITQPPPSPTPRPSATPSALPAISGEKSLAPLPGGSVNWYAWSGDGSTLFILGAGGRLTAQPAGGGPAQTLVPDGASGPSLAPDGSVILYVRAGRLSTVSIKDGHIIELAGIDQPTVPATGWQGTRPLWAQPDGAYALTGGAAGKIGAIPDGGQIWSFAPGGLRFAFQEAHTLFLFDLGTGKSGVLGEGNSPFYGWSSDGSRAIYGAQAGTLAGDLSGQPPLKLSGPDLNGSAIGADWSSRGQVLIGAAAALYAVAADGSGFHKAADGEYLQPLFSPDGRSLAFTRRGSLWTAQLGPDLAPNPVQPALDEPNRVVQDFMAARVAHDPTGAGAHLDQAGRASYSGGALSLLYPDDPRLSRWFILFAESTGSGYRYTVRVVLASGRVESRYVDETLILVRGHDGAIQIDRASGAFPRPAGAGPEILGVEIQPSTLVIAFDSDLSGAGLDSAATITRDGSSGTITVRASFNDRHLTLAGAALQPGKQYHLSVGNAIRDVSGRPLASQFDLDFIAPANP